jgi:hypothetical protein
MIIKESPDALEGSSLQVGPEGGGTGGLDISQGSGYKHKTQHYLDVDFKMISPQNNQELHPQRCHSMSVQIVPPTDEPKVTKTTHQLIKTKSMRVRLCPVTDCLGREHPQLQISHAFLTWPWKPSQSEASY